MLAATEFTRTIEMANTVMMITGLLLLVGWAVRTWRGRRGADVAMPAEPVLDPPMELVLLPMLVFVLAAMLCEVAVRAIVELPEGAAGDDSLPSQGIVLVTNLSMLLGAAAAYVAGRFSMTGSRRSLIVGRGSVLRQVAVGVMGVLIAFAVCQVIYLATVQLIAWAVPGYEFPQHSAISALDDPASPTWMPALIWVGTVLISPVAEELFFRGLIQSYLMRRFDRPAIGLIVTAVLFGLAHAQQPQVVPAITVFGLILGILTVRTNGLLAPIVAHALFNYRTLLWESFRLTTG